MTKRRRAVRREEERTHQKLVRDLDKLAAHAPGGAPERAIDIASPSEVEVRARSMPCPLCGGEMRIDEHTAETIGGQRLRVAKVVCSMCRAPRSIYFRLAMLN